MVNYGVAFKLPFTNWGRLGLLFLLASFAGISQLADKRILPALGLNLAWALLIFLVAMFFSLVVGGYSFRIAGCAARGKNIMPQFEKFFWLVTPPLKYTIALIAYALPLIFFIGLTAFMLGMRLPLAGLLLMITTALFAIMWMFLLFYAGPMLVTHFAHENRFMALFELRKVLKYAFSAAYFAPWLAASTYSGALLVPFFIFAIIFGMASLVSPLLSLFIIPVSSIYTVIVSPTAMNLYGQAYHEITAGKKETKGITVAAAAVSKKAKRRGKK